MPGLHLVAAARGSVPIADLLWFTSGRAVEERALGGIDELLLGTPFERVVLELEPSGGGAPSLARLASRTPPGVLSAWRALRRHRTEVLLALGGFTALPAAIAARLRIVLEHRHAQPSRDRRRIVYLGQHELVAQV